MRKLLGGARPHVLTIAIVAVLSIAGIAAANRSIRDNTINTRDIKDNQVNSKDVRNGSLTTRDIRDNQVNTRDVRDGALRGSDVHDGSLGLEDLSAAAVDYAGTATLFDPRAHDQDSDGNGAVDDPSGTVPGHVCCLSWAQGPALIDPVTAPSSDPIPSLNDGRGWRSVVLDPGAYVIQSTGYAEKAGEATAGVASRLFLGGKPLSDAGGYAFFPASTSGLPLSVSHTTAIEVGGGLGRRPPVGRASHLAGRQGQVQRQHSDLGGDAALAAPPPGSPAVVSPAVDGRAGRRCRRAACSRRRRSIRGRRGARWRSAPTGSSASCRGAGSGA